jgi:protein-S-isoprenylcysteine O-methyltransferase Ste14
MWTAETTIQPDHQIVDSGPYAVVRHPIYSTVIVMYLGLALAFASWASVVPVVIITLAYASKARLEDDTLTEHLPGYAEYKTKTHSRLIPRVW